MGCTSSAADKSAGKKQPQDAPPALLTSEAGQAKPALLTEAGQAEPMQVTADIVNAGMKAFEEAYNREDFDFCGQCYKDQCFVTVNGGKEDGGFGPFTSPAEVSDFLKQLRNELGGTNIKFTVTEVQGCKHTDTWVADNGTGTCDADWVQVGSSWKIEKAAITFTPNGKGETQNGAAAEIPADIVNEEPQKEVLLEKPEPALDSAVAPKTGWCC